MTYLQDKKRNRDRALLILVVVVLLGALFLGASRIQQALFSVVTPIATGTDAARTGLYNGVGNLLVTKKQLQSKVIVLESELATYKQKEGAYTLQETELQSLRQSLHNTEIGYKKTLITQSSATSVYGTFLTTVPSASIAVVGDYVVGDTGAVLGIVSLVKGGTATIITLDSIGSSLLLKLSNTDITIEANKQSRGVLSARVPRGTVIEPDDITVLASDQSLIVGSVAHISDDEKNPYVEVFVRMRDTVQSSRLLYLIQK
jgi:cell shape-determining protein MreC